jgi:predicted metal-dependent peptidase
VSVDDVIGKEFARLSSVRTELLAHHPFWGHLLLQVALVPAPDLPAFAATDCIRHIWFNPLRTRNLTHAQLGFVIAHELGHQIFLSHDREAERDPHKWNCATDYAINRIVAGIRDPEGRRDRLYTPPDGEIPGEGRVQILLDPRFDGMIAEAIYTLIDEDGLPEPVGVEVVLPVPEAGLDMRPPGCADHGGGVDIHLPVELTPAERGELERRIGEALERASREGGDTPGTTVRTVKAHGSRVNWRARLHALITPLVGSPDEFDRGRPRLRWLEHGVLVPGMRSERCGRVVVALDTSGSMSPEDLAKVLGELRALAPLTEELTVLVGDTEVQEVLDVDQALERVEGGGWKGGGGTDHRPIFKWIDRSDEVPDVFIGLTDLYTKLPKRAPEYPVIWVLPGKHGEVPWGTEVRLR